MGGNNNMDYHYRAGRMNILKGEMQATLLPCPQFYKALNLGDGTAPVD